MTDPLMDDVVTAVTSPPGESTSSFAVEPKQVSFDEFVKALARAERRRTFDLDVRGILALMVVVAFFVLIFIQQITTETIKLPAEVAAVVTGVTGFYFGAKGGSDRATNGHGK